MINDHFQHNHRNGCKKWHFKNSKSNVKLFGKFSNHDILIFSNHPQSKFVHRHPQIITFQLFKNPAGKNFYSGKELIPGRTAPKKWNQLLISPDRFRHHNSIMYSMYNIKFCLTWHILYSFFIFSFRFHTPEYIERIRYLSFHDGGDAGDVALVFIWIFYLIAMFNLFCNFHNQFIVIL